jgi:threonylcarbamoyladenosine tRNA methylthiotransferase MtaB
VSRRTVAIATLGCRLNQVDSQEIAARFEARGFRTVPFESAADVVIVNTCTVTGRADASDRQMIRRAARRHPGARVVVTGCWAQTNPAAVASLRGVAAVVGNADKLRLPDIAEELLATPPAAPRMSVTDIATVHTIAAPPHVVASGRARAFLKVQEGCRHRCAFCIVPRARGTSRSVDPALAVARVRELVALGHHEVVLTGVDLGHYGADLTPRTSLASLVARLVRVPGLRWLRLSSLLPAYFTPDLMDVATSSDVIAPHFHIPLQSGSDRILRLMRRPYTASMYRALIERLVARVPGMGLGADVIVGFPGETEEDFQDTVRLVRDLPFSYLHVFPYSERAGTAAAGLTGRVDAETMASRGRALRELATAKNLAFRRAMIGRVEDALVLEERDRTTGHLVGLTGNYVEVTFEGADDMARTMTTVRVTSADARTTRGEAHA